MPTQVAYRTNADGSISVLGFKHVVRIGALQARYQQAFGARNVDGTWMGPEPVACGNCGATAAFCTRQEPRGEELVFIHYQCAACGAREIEPFD